MSIWIIDPHEPLIFREGKPFGPTPGARARSLPFPFPSTTAGGVRTQIGLDEQGVFKQPADEQERVEWLQQLKGLNVQGPLLVQLTADGDIDEGKWLLPAPADALLLSPEQAGQAHTEAEPEEIAKAHALIQRLVPLDLRHQAVYTDFDQKNAGNLWLVGLPFIPNPPKIEKPHKSAPAYWYWEKFSQWLLDPASLNAQKIDVRELGQSKLPTELRVHVAIDASLHASKEHMLFDTSGLEFTHIEPEPETLKRPDLPLQHAKRLALAVIVDDQRLQDRIGNFGGERRLVSWRQSNSLLLDHLKVIKDSIKAAIIRDQDKACRLVLLTPAYFAKGYLPRWIGELHDGVQPQLKAIAVQRPQVVSGWDMEKKAPKSSRRLAPAGTVLFLHLTGDDKAISQWIDEMWMHCISDDRDTDEKSSEYEDQYRRDGFGLAILGTWPREEVQA